MIISATTRLSIAQASAAKNAEAKFTRTATLPIGISEKRCASIRYNGNPGGCATPRKRAATVSSPLSTSVTVGARVEM